MGEETYLLNEAQLSELLAYWQEELRLTHWRLTAQIVRGSHKKEGIKGTNCDADLDCDYLHQVGVISIVDSTDYDDRLIPQDMEVLLVHELIHFLTLPFDMNVKRDSRKYDLIEVFINIIAAALVKHRRNGRLGPDIFHPVHFEIELDMKMPSSPFVESVPSAEEMLHSTGIEWLTKLPTYLDYHREDEGETIKYRGEKMDIGGGLVISKKVVDQLTEKLTITCSMLMPGNPVWPESSVPQEEAIADKPFIALRWFGMMPRFLKDHRDESGAIILPPKVAGKFLDNIDTKLDDLLTDPYLATLAKPLLSSIGRKATDARDDSQRATNASEGTGDNERSKGQTDSSSDLN